MKSLSITALIVALVSGSTFAQTSGGGSAAASGSAAPVAPSAAPKTPRPGQNQPQMAPPAAPVQVPAPTPPSTVTSSSSSNGSVSNSTDVNASVTQSNMTAEVTNQFGGSNGFGFGTNGFATNFLGGGAVDTNQFGTNGLTPTSQPGLTNRIFGTNNFGLTNSTGALFRDQAITSPDRQLLSQLRSAVFGANLSPEQLAAQPVHFILANGIVRLVGEVPSLEQRQQVEAAVQRVPGVVRIYDALSVSGQPGLAVNVLPGNTPQNALSPVSEPGSGDNRIYATNSPGSPAAPGNTPNFPGMPPSAPAPGANTNSP